MQHVVNDHSRAGDHLEPVVSALGTGVILLDGERQIAWMDERTRARLNGGMAQLAATLRAVEAADGIACTLAAHEVMINGEAALVCLIQEHAAASGAQGYDAIAAVEAAVRTIVEKLKALRQPTPAPRTADLDVLTDREREVLALICEGRSDAEMGAMLHLSQNTIRNHIASLYRKIGVNRRSAAIIWARERAITSQDALGLARRPRPRLHHPQEKPD
jgi:DNA-binding CsgD family transcriptional regulator